MADSIRQVDYYQVQVPDTPGKGARVLQVFQDAGVNLLAFHAFPREEHSQLDMIPEDGGAFEAVARKAGIDIGPRKSAFLVHGEDRPGAIAGILTSLGKSRINVIAMDALTVGDRFGSLFWVPQERVEEAAEILGAARASGSPRRSPPPSR